MVGLGSDDSIARIDNVAVQVLPPEIRFEHTVDFSGGIIRLFDSKSTGQWQVVDKRFEGQPIGPDDRAVSTVDASVAASATLQIEARLRADHFAGVVFDKTSPEHFKFVALSVPDKQVIIGHHTSQRGWEIDKAASREIVASRDYQLDVSLKGTTVSVDLDGQAALGHVFNAVTVDGQFGLFSRDASAAFESVALKTNDPAWSAMTDALDVNGDGQVTPMDVLLVINALNRLALSDNSSVPASPAHDVNQDGAVTPLDALLVINQVNSDRAEAAGEPFQDVNDLLQESVISEQLLEDLLSDELLN
jgi:hypothetical protein